MAYLDVIDPTTGERTSRVEADPPERIDQRLDRAVHAQRAWSQRPFAERARVLTGAADILRRRAPAYAAMMAEEMGKPLGQGRAEAEKCAWLADHYAQHGAAMLAPERVETDGRHSYVQLEPLGVILAIMPWNYPFWQVFRCAVPALIGGNAVALKHAENVPGCARTLEQLFVEAGLLEGVFTSLLVERERAEPLVVDPRIAAVALTGSDRAGARVAALAGAETKRCVLELGGSDAFIVLEDADLEQAAEVGAKARCQNSGQSCIAAKRFIAVSAIAERFAERLRGYLAHQVVGDPRAPGTDIGPLARADLLDALQSQVERSVEQGARIALGGEPMPGRGFFYPPTLIDRVVSGMPVWEEETFGPVAALMVVQDESAAIAAANESRYGLGASVWTEDRARGERIAARLATGMVFVNGMVKSDPRLPFGGVKRSGYGRELSWHGLHELMNPKTIWVG